MFDLHLLTLSHDQTKPGNEAVFAYVGVLWWLEQGIAGRADLKSNASVSSQCMKQFWEMRLTSTMQR